jgi:hypothetical protein
MSPLENPQYALDGSGEKPFHTTLGDNYSTGSINLMNTGT